MREIDLRRKRKVSEKTKEVGFWGYNLLRESLERGSYFIFIYLFWVGVGGGRELMLTALEHLVSLDAKASQHCCPFLGSIFWD